MRKRIAIMIFVGALAGVLIGFYAGNRDWRFSPVDRREINFEMVVDGIVLRPYHACDSDGQTICVVFLDPKEISKHAKSPHAKEVVIRGRSLEQVLHGFERAFVVEEGETDTLPENDPSVERA